MLQEKHAFSNHGGHIRKVILKSFRMLSYHLKSSKSSMFEVIVDSISFPNMFPPPTFKLVEAWNLLSAASTW